MTNGLQYISVRIYRNEGGIPVIKGSGTLFEDEGKYYVLTAYHCISTKDADGTLLPFDKDKTEVVLYFKKTEIGIVITSVADYDIQEDWILLNVLKPSIEQPYFSRVRFSNELTIGENYDTYPFPSVCEGKPRYTPLVAVNDIDQFHINDNISGGRFTSDMVMKGGSGAGIVKESKDEIYYFGYLKSTLPGGAFNDVLSGSVEGFMHNLSKEATKRITLLESLQIKKHEKENYVKSVSQDITKASADHKELEIVEYLLENTILSLIDLYKTETAEAVLKDIKQQMPDIESFEHPLSAKYHYIMALCYNAMFDFDNARLHFHEAYLRDSDTPNHIEHEVLYRFHNNDEKGAKTLIATLPNDNEFKLAYSVFASSDSSTAFSSLSDELQKKPSFLYRIVNFTYGKKMDLSWVLNGYKPFMPDALTVSNTPDWIILLTYYRVKFRDYILFVRPDELPGKEDYKEAFTVTSRFFALAESTPLARNLPIIWALHCYWGYLLEGDSNWIEKFNRVNFANAGDQEDYCAMLAAAILSMTGKPVEGYFAIRSHHLKHNETLLRFVIGLTAASADASILINYLSEHKSENVVISLEMTNSLASLSSVLKDDDYIKILDSCTFAHLGSKQVLYDAISLNTNTEVNISGYENFINDLTGNTASLASILMARNGQPELAKAYIRKKFEEKRLPTYSNALLQLLQAETKDAPELYALLKSLRQEGTIFGLDQLLMEYNLALQLTDFSEAFDIIELVFQLQPNSERYYSYYIDLMGKTNPDLLREELIRIASFEFTDVHFVIVVYTTLAQNQYINEAAEFLLKHVLLLGGEALSSYFDKECISGFLNTIVNEKYEVITDGCYAIIEMDSRREPRKVKRGTLLGDQLIGKKDGEEFDVILSGDKKKVKVIKIQNKFAHQHALHLKEIMENGGNQFFTPIKVDPSHPEQILDKLKEISGGVDHDELRKNIYRDYLEGKTPLIQMISQDDIVGDYYRFLFSQFRLQLQPYQVCVERKKYILNNEVNIHIDFTSLILLFEFNQLHPEVEIPQVLQLPRLNLEMLKDYRKNLHVLRSFSLYEAMQQGHLHHFSQKGDEDLDTRFQTMLSWIESHCVITDDPNVLVVSSQSDNPIAKLFCNTYAPLTNLNRNPILVSEDTNVEFFMHTLLPVITTESFVYGMFGDDVGEKFSIFLTENNNAGANVPVSYICEQYTKFEAKQPNKLDVILDVNSINLNIANIHQSSISIIKNAKEKDLAMTTVKTLISNLVNHTPQNITGSPMWNMMLLQLSQDPLTNQYLLPIYTEILNRSLEK